MVFVLGRDKKRLSIYKTSGEGQTQFNLAARLTGLDPNNLSDKALSRLLGDIDLHNLTDTDAVLLDELLGFEAQYIKHGDVDLHNLTTTNAVLPGFEAQRVRHGDINDEVRMVLMGATGNGKEYTRF
ncbi:unnamed protein product [Adineta steineri]|uniref:Uncharacterized protein n=1 Tax=Adineta steineri TaxID=433720 RepID=A0A818J954_9BILA|nr:unnamed protein product [Adineta steineri]CAF3535511.1 unnamed protein product [Adineta steineri]